MFLGTATGSIKSSLKDRYTYRWPSTEDAAFDLFNPARIYQWCAAIHRVRVAYAKVNGRRPRLLRPQRYTEKIQWRKLFDLNPVYATISDKLTARDFIAKRVGAHMLPPLLWSGDDPAVIPINTLDTPYVIKGTHACGHVLKVWQRQDFDAEGAISVLQDWLGTDYGRAFDEPANAALPRRLLIERLLLRADGKPPLERRFYVFAGRVRFVQTTFADDDGLHHRAFNDRAWRPLEWYFKTPNQPEQCHRPKRYDDLVALAECLGQGFDHIRVDMYDADDELWVGELTVYPLGGLTSFTPDEADKIVGSYWNLHRPARRALGAVLFRWRRIRLNESDFLPSSGRFLEESSAARETTCPPHPSRSDETRHTAATAAALSEG
jgi:TupA-like ATPgrasp